MAPEKEAGYLRVEPEESAELAGLRYLHDDEPGISRQKAGKGFLYRLPDGEKVEDERTLRRIAGLVLPPAWEEVWISPLENSHLQATGRDSKGRKQYRYHRKWSKIRNRTKFDRTLEFARALPELRRRVDADLRRHLLSRERILATVTRLLERSLIRIGNEEYERENHSFGLTTMRRDHAELSGSKIRFLFRGKGGKMHRVTVRSGRLIRVLRRCQELPGQRLFQYRDEGGEVHPVDSEDVNGYIRAATGSDFTAKDFRTWAGTFLTALSLREMGRPTGVLEARKNVVEAIKRTAKRLGNRPATCRKGYVHPALIDCYLDSGFDFFGEAEGGEPESGLSEDENLVLRILERCSVGWKAEGG